MDRISIEGKHTNTKTYKKKLKISCGQIYGYFFRSMKEGIVFPAAHLFVVDRILLCTYNVEFWTHFRETHKRFIICSIFFIYFYFSFTCLALASLYYLDWNFFFIYISFVVEPAIYRLCHLISVESNIIHFIKSRQ